MQPLKTTINVINQNVTENLQQCVLNAEQNYKSQVQRVVDYIIENNHIKFIFLAGPSGSGKTTTSHIISQKLKEVGIKTMPLSLDDYFVNREETPNWDDGEPNFETADAIDWKLFAKCMKGLLSGQAVKLPTYNFTTGYKEYGSETIADKNTVFVVEGLHALNPIVAQFMPENVFCNLFISANTEIYVNDKVVIEHQNVRLFRRLIRDLYTRSTSLSENVAMWKKVRLGEKLYISPFKDNAQFYINSFHEYELGIYKSIFCNLKSDDVALNKICEMLKDFNDIDKNIVPVDSVLQEFMPKK